MWVIERGEILNKLSYRHRLTFSGYKEANGNLYALKIVVLLPIKRKLRMEIAMTKMFTTWLKTAFCFLPDLKGTFLKAWWHGAQRGWKGFNGDWLSTDQISPNFFFFYRSDLPQLRGQDPIRHGFLQKSKSNCGAKSCQTETKLLIIQKYSK